MIHGVTKARALGLLMAILVLAPLGAAEMPSTEQNTTDDWCAEERWGRDRAGVCEVRQFTVAATGSVLAVRGTNGGIAVEGAARNDVHILARVIATADSDARAREIANSIRINPNLELVEAQGPGRLQSREGWSVSYRLAVPRALNLSLQTSNGGISIRDVESKVEFRTTNGGVKLRSVGGDVRGSTTNGGVDVDLDGPSWSGEGLDVETSNGGVKIAIPEQYSAKLEASTNNGGLSIDYPGAVHDRRDREVSLQLGSGGAPIRVRTTNGGLRVTRK